MAVFTEVTPAQAQALVSRLNLGTVQSLRGISAGIENTNYFVTTDAGDYVLTVFERLSFAQLPFYLQLMKHLAARGLAVPDPQADGQGEILFELNGKPAALVNKLRGGHQLAPDLFHCEQVGAALARMHLAGQDFPLHQPNLRGLAWWTETVPLILPYLSPEQAELIGSELRLPATTGCLGQPCRAAARPHSCRPVPRQRDVRGPARPRTPERLLRLLLRRRRQLAVRPGRLPQRLVHRPGQRPPRRAARGRLRARLRKPAAA